jgi:hydroxyacylglutathione hydrolase
MIEVTPLPAFSDNYLWLLHRSKEAAVVDPGDGQVVLAALREQGLRLTAILITHHHPDHIGGVPALLREWQVPVYGPRAEADKIGVLTQTLDDGDRVAVLGLDLEVLAVPGHTLGHIAYYAAVEKLLFCGDTLFASGCGRLFEGSAQQMFSSLQRLSALPADTAMYCAHEYTLGNLDFARQVEPGPSLEAEIERVQALRARDLPSLPSTIRRERALNPFLRCSEPAAARSAAGHVGRPLPDAVGVFAVLRKWKDSYKSTLR